jgi:hypothetical protein
MPVSTHRSPDSPADDLAAEMATLAQRGVQCGTVEQARWGSLTMIPLPGSGSVGLYQPSHRAMVEPA